MWEHVLNLKAKDDYKCYFKANGQMLQNIICWIVGFFVCVSDENIKHWQINWSLASVN